jgi:predicted nucleotidyltransferase
MAGSHSYGLSRPESDVDMKGIAFLNKQQIFSLNDDPEQYIEEANDGADADLTIYTMKKFFNLAKTANPNILEMLYNSKDNVLFVSPVGQLLMDNRDLFISKKARWSFIGYSDSQLKRINTHRKWLLNPPTDLPKREDYSLPAMPEIKKDQRRAFLKLVSNILERKVEYFEGHLEFQRLYGRVDWFQEMNELTSENYDDVQSMLGVDTNFMYMIKQESKYERDVKHYGQYLNWKKNRNPVRAEMEAKSGYDLKHAMHLVRLMTMGREIITDGTLITDRREAGDHEFLMSIRNGAFSYDEIIEISNKIKQEIDDSFSASTIPDKPDNDKIHELYERMLNECYK